MYNVIFLSVRAILVVTIWIAHAKRHTEIETPYIANHRFIFNQHKKTDYSKNHRAKYHIYVENRMLK